MELKMSGGSRKDRYNFSSLGSLILRGFKPKLKWSGIKKNKEREMEQSRKYSARFGYHKSAEVMIHPWNIQNLNVCVFNYMREYKIIS